MSKDKTISNLNDLKDLSFGFRVLGFEFRLIKRFNASTVTSQQSPVKRKSKDKSLKSNVKRQDN